MVRATWLARSGPHSVLSVRSLAKEPPQARCLSGPPLICPIDGDWQLQVHPGAPGTARSGTRTKYHRSTYDGGNATQPRAPGHERPRAALRAARHGRLSAASTAPGADVPRATPARVPGQYCLSAAPRAPGHGRPLAITAGAPCRDRLSAALRAPADDAAPAITATAPRHHRPCAAPIATVSSPAGLHRLRQECLPRVPANPRTLTYSPAHQTSQHSPSPPCTQASPARHRPPSRPGTTEGPDPLPPEQESTPLHRERPRGR